MLRRSGAFDQGLPQVWIKPGPNAASLLVGPLLARRLPDEDEKGESGEKDRTHKP